MRVGLTSSTAQPAPHPLRIGWRRSRRRAPSCLVFGAHGDASRDVELVLTEVARLRAHREWRALGGRTEAEAYGAIVAGLRRFVGVASMREFARHRLHRLPLVGVPRAVIDARRQALQGVGER